MLRQNTSKAFMQMTLAFVLSLCSLSAFSEGYKNITFLQETGADKDHYTVTAAWEWSYFPSCVANLSSPHLETAPGDGGQTIKITYLKTDHGCDMISSMQMFEVRSRQHTDRVAIIYWVKEAGMAPYVNNVFNDPLGLTTVDDSDPDNIKVWLSYDG